MSETNNKPMPHAEISFMLDEFPVAITIYAETGTDLLAAVERATKALRVRGATPPDTSATGNVATPATSSIPVCPYHGPMKESTKRPGTYFCAAKMGDGTYCKEKHPR